MLAYLQSSMLCTPPPLPHPTHAHTLPPTQQPKGIKVLTFGSRERSCKSSVKLSGRPEVRETVTIDVFSSRPLSKANSFKLCMMQYSVELYPFKTSRDNSDLISRLLVCRKCQTERRRFSRLKVLTFGSRERSCKSSANLSGRPLTCFSSRPLSKANPFKL